MAKVRSSKSRDRGTVSALMSGFLDAAEGWPSTKKKHLEAKQVEAIEAIRKLASRGKV